MSATAATSPGRRATFHSALARTSSVQKTSKGAPAYSRFVNRRLGRYIAAAAYAFGLTPNQVTAISACFSYGSILAVALIAPNALLGVMVALGLVLGYAFDSADGQLARLRGGGSPAGEWLDHMVDCAKISALHLAVFVSFYRHQPHDGWRLALPLAFGAVAAVFFFGTILTDQLRRDHWRDFGKPEAEGAPLLRSLLVLPTDYGLMCLVFFALGADDVFAGLYGVLLLGTAVFLAMVCIKWYREIDGFSAARAAG